MSWTTGRRKTSTLGWLCVFISIAMVMLVISCAGGQRELKRPKIKIHSMELAKAVEQIGSEGVPVNPTTVFSAEDKQVVALLKFDNISGSYMMRWDWYRPDHSLHCSSGNLPVNISQGKFIRTMTVWHALDLEADQALKLTGQWFVKFYVNNELVDSKAFDFENGRNAGQWPGAGAKGKSTFENNWGLVIGIQDYPNLPEVKFVHQDVAKVKDWFIRTLYVPEDHVVTLLDNNATKKRIQDFIRYFLSENAKKDSNLYVYYAGHGSLDAKSGKPSLLPYESIPGQIDAFGYRLDELVRDLEALNTHRTYLFLDTSFNRSGHGADKSRRAAADKRPTRQDKDLPKSLSLNADRLMVMGAATGGQDNNVSEKDQAGLFTYYLTRSLDVKLRPELKEANATIGDLFTYVADNVEKDTPDNKQTPWIVPPLDKVGKLAMFQKNL